MTKPRVYDAPEWKAVRLAVLARDGHRCQIRGPKCKGAARHVDHVRSVSDGGAPFDPANLRAACSSCNIAKRNTEVAARARGVRAGDVAPTVEIGRPKYPSEMTRQEFIDWCGFDWPEPPSGWAKP